jgi:hypothetical protein
MEISLPRHDIIAHKIFNLNASGRQDWFPSLAICHGCTTAFKRYEPGVVQLRPAADISKVHVSYFSSTVASGVWDGNGY